MFKSRLFLEIFSASMLVVAALAAAMWLFTVPLVERKAYEIELEASRTILDNVFEMTAKMAGRLDETRDLTLKAYEAQLRTAVTLAVGLIEGVEARRAAGEIGDDDVGRLAWETLRSIKWAEDDYVWVSDYRAHILSHPDPRWHGNDVSSIKDEAGENVIPRVIEIARRDGEGSTIYDWVRPGSNKPSRKISYFRDLPKLGVVVGAGAWLDDIDAEVARRRVRAIDDMRRALREIRIARTGYAYIFDAANNMIIHPNANIEGQEFTTRTDPKSGERIADELKAVADSDRPLHYMWDKPSDPGDYVYEKISWVRHFKEFDWYIASSVYVEELKSSSQELSRRILAVTAGVGLFAALLGGLGVWRFVLPLRAMAETASRVSAGDLDARTGIRRNDEIGLLAQTFDTMVGRVGENVGELEDRVRARTAELEAAIVAEQRTQSRLAEADARQRLILDAIPAAIAYLGPDERFRFVNRAWSELVGRSKAAIVGEELRPIIGRAAWETLQTPLTRTRRGEVVNLEYAFEHRSGRRIVTANTLIPQIAANGATIGCFVLTRDVTDERETERRIFEAEHLKAIGQLSGGLAHDFNNLLSIIIGNLATAREKYADVDGFSAYVEPAERAARRGADLTSRLLSFARRQPMRSETLEVAALLAEIGTLLRRSLPHTVDVALDAEGGRHDFWIVADHVQLERAVVNLALNARDAMPDGGHIRLVCRRLAADQRNGWDEPVPEGRWIEIAVVDDGQGFPEGALARAFEPFYTTKKMGSGLGLAMVWGFVKQSQGFIRIVSEPGRGASVSLLFAETDPLADQPPIAAPPSDGEALFPGAMAIVVEDDDDVRRMALEQMVGLGFSVIEAESGEEALSLIAGISDIRVVVSDVVMPGLSGLDLARRLRADHPAIAVVLVTGFARGEAPEDLVDVPVLTKPWEREDLIGALASAIRARGGEDKERTP
ncbi:MAG: cache domain-containing protein [Hyphomicrobiales bacterium]|nr:cache domain-containing protein [Hyphomicrobiales bacterium]